MKDLANVFDWFRRAWGPRPPRVPGNDRDDQLPPTLGEQVVRVVRNAIVAGVALSVAFHVVLWIISAFITVGGSGPGPGPARPVEFAIVSEAELDKLVAQAVDTSSPSVPELTAPNPQQADLMEGLAGIDAPAASVDVSELGPIVGGGDIGDAGAALGGTGGGGGASFFGVEAQGSRFAYIVDVSGSMSTGGRIDALRRELTLSIGKIVETGSFLVLAYSDNARPLGERLEWLDATSAPKRWAVERIAALRAEGGTNPLPAFELLSKLRTKPDSIYLLTDGDFADEIVDQIAALNTRPRIPIHCICFAEQTGEDRMKRLASMSGGTYTFVRGPQ